MRRSPVAEIQNDLIDIAPAPSFRRIVGFDDRMVSLVKVFGSMPMRRAVAATNMTAGPAKPKMYPRRTDFQAFLAPECAWRYVTDAGDVRTFLGHQDLVVEATVSAASPFRAR